MELSTCVLTSSHLCQLITDLRKCRTYICVFVCCLSVLCFWYEISLSLNFLEYSRYSKIEIFHIKNRGQTHRQTHKSTYWVAAQLKIESKRIWSKKISLEKSKREGFHIKNREQTNNKQTHKEILHTSYTYEGQLSTYKDERKLGHMLIVPFPVWAGIKINSSPNRKWNLN